MSNSFLGHPDKSKFSAATGQTALIQINHVQHRTLICRSDSSAMPPVLSCRAQVDTRQIATQPSSERISRLHKIILFARMFRPEYFQDEAPVTGLVSK